MPSEPSCDKACTFRSRLAHFFYKGLTVNILGSAGSACSTAMAPPCAAAQAGQASGQRLQTLLEQSLPGAVLGQVCEEEEQSGSIWEAGHS